MLCCCIEIFRGAWHKIDHTESKPKFCKLKRSRKRTCVDGEYAMTSGSEHEHEHDHKHKNRQNYVRAGSTSVRWHLS